MTKKKHYNALSNKELQYANDFYDTTKKQEFSEQELELVKQKREYEKRKQEFLLYLQKGMEKYKLRLIVDPNSTLKEPKITII